MSETIQRQPTACILCSENCGLEVVVEEGHITRIKGDRHHPASQGYLCEKAGSLDYYQNHNDRLASPLRRREDGMFEAISWDVAIAEIAQRLLDLRAAYGPHSLAFYGGAGQGNHLHLIYAVGFRLALGTPYMYHALGQEKTGDFWLDGELFGSQANHTTNDIENAHCVMFSGTNPWHAHGFPRARQVLREISKDPNRTMIVVDPRRTETSELADFHLQVRPGTDAFLFAAMLATIAQEGLVDQAFIAARTTGYQELEAIFRDIPIDAYAAQAGVNPQLARRAALAFATAKSACVRSDLGLQQSFHSTLNLYLEKLFYLLTGNFGKKGGNNFHAHTIPLLWHSDRKDPNWDEQLTKVNRMFPIAGFFPPNILPAEIDTDHPERLRGLVVDSANPVVTGANTLAYREAFKKLELLVVVDTAMTETAELAHYVLPAASQFEKYECTFFNWGFPVNHLHLRHPILPRREGTLPEQEIYMRLVNAMGMDVSQHPLFGPFEQLKHMPAVQALPPDMQVATVPLLYAAHGFVELHKEAVERAGIADEGEGLAVALYKRIITSRSGTPISRHNYEDCFAFIKHEDGKIHLAVDDMLSWLKNLADELGHGGLADPEHPYLLCAGERRSSNATTNYRNPDWRRKDPEGFIRIHPDDARDLDIADGDQIICATRTSELAVCAHIDDTVQRGICSMPHGFGLKYTGSDGRRRMHGPLINLLTATDHCDPLTKTPYHKNVPVRLRKA